jgi:hypothetical protein
MQRPEKRLPHIDMDVVQVLEPDNFDPSTGEVIPGSLASGWYLTQDDTGKYNQFHVFRHSFEVRKYIEDLGYKIENTEDLLASLLPTNAIISLDVPRPFNFPKPVLQPLLWNPSQEKLPSVVVQAEEILRRQ